jgi:hypothetical protein
MYACIREIGGGFFEGMREPSNASAPSCDPPPPATREYWSSSDGAPARSGSLAALPWTAL